VKRRPAAFVRIGKDVESVVLARAVRWQAERRVLLIGHRTVVFHQVREAARHCAGRWWGMEEEWRAVALYAIVIHLLGESSCQPLPPPF
jgi:hypothetical protein